MDYFFVAIAIAVILVGLAGLYRAARQHSRPWLTSDALLLQRSRPGAQSAALRPDLFRDNCLRRVHSLDEHGSCGSRLAIAGASCSAIRAAAFGASHARRCRTIRSSPRRCAAWLGSGVSLLR